MNSGGITSSKAIAGTSPALLVGKHGAERACELVALLRSRRLAIINRQYGLASATYTPWHSLLSRTKDAASLIDLHVRLKPRALSLIADSDLLKNIARVVRGDGEFEFAALGKDRYFASSIHQEISSRPGQFSALVAESVELLRQSASWLSDELEAAVDFFVPILHAPNGVHKKRAMSCIDTHGAVYVTLLGRDERHARVELAVDIAHELGHHLLMAYQLCDPLIASDQVAPVYSGVRRTLRPAILSLHAACALVFMANAAEYMSKLPSLTMGELRFLKNWAPDLKSSLTLTLQSLESKCEFTQLGRAIIDEFWHSS